MNPTEYIQRLTDTSIKKLKNLKELITLTENQSEAINSEDIEKLNLLIDEKQQRLNAIDKLDDEFNVYFLRLKQTLKISSLEEIKDKSIPGVKELQTVISGIMDIIREISGLEKINNAKAKNILDNYGNEIKKVNQGKKTNAAYNPTQIGQPPSYFIDKKK